MSRHRYKVGDRVRIKDGSEAHGETGTVRYVYESGLMHVRLDADGILWPVDPQEVEPIGQRVTLNEYPCR